MKYISLLLSFFILANIAFAKNTAEIIHINAEMYLTKLTPNSYIHTAQMDSGGGKMVECNGMLLVDDGKAFLFDTPTVDSTTKILVNFIKDSLKLEIVGCIVNDWHWDSMGGLKVINDLGIPTYANEMTRELAKEKKLPIPTLGFKDFTTIKFGKFNIECYYLGAAHTKDGIVVWIPSEQVLFADCMIKDLATNNLGYTGDGDLKEYPITLQKVKVKFPNIKFVIPGHGLYGGVELLDKCLKTAKGN